MIFNKESEHIFSIFSHPTPVEVEPGVPQSGGGGAEKNKYSVLRLTHRFRYKHIRPINDEIKKIR